MGRDASLIGFEAISADKDKVSCLKDKYTLQNCIHRTKCHAIARRWGCPPDPDSMSVDEVITFYLQLEASVFRMERICAGPNSLVEGLSCRRDRFCTPACWSPISRFTHRFVTLISSVFAPCFSASVMSIRNGFLHTKPNDFPLTTTSARFFTSPRSRISCSSLLSHVFGASTILKISYHLQSNDYVTDIFYVNRIFRRGHNSYPKTFVFFNVYPGHNVRADDQMN